MAGLGRQGLEHFTLRVEMGGEAADAGGVELFGEDVGEDDAVLQGVAVAGGALGAVGEDEPAAVRAAHEVAGQMGKPAAAGRGDAGCGAEEARVGVEDAGRQKASLDECLRPVEVGQDGVEQTRPLVEAGADMEPFVLAEEEGEDIEGPGAAGAECVVIDIVSDTMVAQQTLDGGGARLDVLRSALGQEAAEGAPMRAQGAAGQEHLIVDSGLRPVPLQQAAASGRFMRRRGGACCWVGGRHSGGWAFFLQIRGQIKRTDSMPSGG